MTKQEFIERIRHATSSMADLIESKNADYTGGNKDPFYTFRAVEDNICSTTTGMLVRMSDKFQRIKALLHGKSAINNESINDTLMDLANYCVILKIYLEETTP